MRRYTVGQLNRELGVLVQRRYPAIEVEGEIGQLNRPLSGHAYLTLRDSDNVLNAVAWRDTWQGLEFQPAVGERVICRGRLGVYAQKGTYQLYVTMIRPAGLGQLAKELAERRARLETEGLLDSRRKRPLPPMVRCVGVATSLAGAALQDFLKVSRERFPAARILVANCVVQGREAPASVVRAVELLLDHGQAEVIVVTRGGGSKEDLLAFHDEQLARYLAHCPVPVVSAVGHQVDTTLADLVADAVAPTPTAAATLVLPDAVALTHRVDEASERLEAAIHRVFDRRHRDVRGLRARLRHPGEHLAGVGRRLMELRSRLQRAMSMKLPQLRDRVTVAEDSLIRRVTPCPALARRRVNELEMRLFRLMNRCIGEQRLRVQTAMGRIEALSPQSVLERGYALVEGPAGFITRAAAVVPDEPLRIRWADGVVAVVVEKD